MERDMGKVLRISVCLAALFSLNAAHAMCSDKEYKIYQAYDQYLENNPQISDDLARNIFAKKVGVSPAKLKDIYFSCLYDSTLGNGAEKRKPEKKSEIESKETAGQSCNSIGFKYGFQAALAMKGRGNGTGIIVPVRCRNLPETNSGIQEGTRAGIRQ